MNVSGLASGFDALLSRAFSGRLRNVGNVFTPRRIVRFMVDAVEVGSEDKLIDPACGTGGFPVWAWRRIIEGLNADQGLSEADRLSRAQHFANSLHACDESPEAIDMTRANMALHGIRPTGGYRTHVRRHDGLYAPFLRRGVDDGRFEPATEGSFTVVACNPPFGGSHNRVRDERILSRFELGDGLPAARIEYLFLERAIRLLAPRGRLAIIMPEGLLSAVSEESGAARDYLIEHVTVLGIVKIPRAVWRTTNSRIETNAAVVLGIRKRRRFAQQRPVVLASATHVEVADPLADDDLQAVLDLVRPQLQHPS